MHRLLPLLLIAVLAAGCNPSLPNRAAAYEAYGGAIALQLKLPAKPDTRAEFFLNGQALAPDTDGSDGYSVLLDTTLYPDGLHTLKARILDASGELIEELEHTLLFKNEGRE